MSIGSSSYWGIFKDSDLKEYWLIYPGDVTEMQFSFFNIRCDSGNYFIICIFDHCFNFLTLK